MEGRTGTQGGGSARMDVERTFILRVEPCAGVGLKAGGWVKCGGRS